MKRIMLLLALRHLLLPGALVPLSCQRPLSLMARPKIQDLLGSWWTLRRRTLRRPTSPWVVSRPSSPSLMQRYTEYPLAITF